MNNKQLIDEIQEYLDFLKIHKYLIYSDEIGDYLDTEFFRNIEKLIKEYKKQEEEIYQIQKLTTTINATSSNNLQKIHYL